jgi:outer membrane protein OmpA-like peptidoglycan-associated protein
MKHILGTLALTLVLSQTANANVCGTDYQNFNPTTGGLDFVTVHSSETLRPCIINMGFFLNYAADSLTYSNVLNATYPAGQRRSDRTLSADFSLGYGLNERWDVGINVPALIKQTVSDNHYVASFDSGGIMEIKANTKYRFTGDASGGVAGIFSINQNLVEDNPFSGKNPGPTLNLEVAADTTLANKWAMGVNVGYRKRNPGTAIAGVPFIPLEDQYIYSIAGSYHFASIDTKLILELYGSKAVKKAALDSDRNLDALEALVGVKHDYTESVALHFGGTHQIDKSLGGSDWRVYAGVNWAMGPICKSPIVATTAPVEVPGKKSSVMEELTLDVEFLFKTNSDSIDPEFFISQDGIFSEFFGRKFQRIVVEGHTDSMGEEEYNQQLSQRRAMFVRQEIIKRYELPKDKIAIVGFGETQPIADNSNFQGRRQNRRVVIKVWR